VGDKNIPSAVNKYYLPVPLSSRPRIDRTSSPAHFDKLKYAVDFVVPKGTPVLAAADGVVSFVKDDSDNGGPSPFYWSFSNFIVIMHSNGEYSRYDHLEHKSCTVNIGQPVKAGQAIAKVGMSGFTFIPHLHFQVFIFTGNNLWTDFITLLLPW